MTVSKPQNFRVHQLLDLHDPDSSCTSPRRVDVRTVDTVSTQCLEAFYKALLLLQMPTFRWVLCGCWVLNWGGLCRVTVSNFLILQRRKVSLGERKSHPHLPHQLTQSQQWVSYAQSGLFRCLCTCF